MLQATERFSIESILPSERARLVRFCAHLSGSIDAAEDLAQETLMEAWRHRDRLRDPAGHQQWLSAIARNVCMRWRRAQGRHSERMAIPDGMGGEPLSIEDIADDDFDLEVELERSELADLLDRAMSLLPAETRTALVEKYVEEMPIAEIGARMGLSEGAVAVRLHRGKLALRRLLANELSDEAVAYGLVDVWDVDWRETRIWCPGCGRRRALHSNTLKNRYGRFILHCPDCFPAFPDVPITVSHTDIWNPGLQQVLGGVRSTKAVLSRMMAWVEGYYMPRLSGRAVPCTGCGEMVPVQLEIPERYAPSIKERQGVFLRCERCNYFCAERLHALGMCLPEGRKFWQDHPRMQALPLREVETAGVPTLVASFRSVTDGAGYDALFVRDTYQLISTHILSE
ncbi:MAG TPA: RNA polymerase sigma factor [Chloroflexia bacterium]|nr:RNA polymerase sigma factor [Chloroflexia bacterium]